MDYPFRRTLFDVAVWTVALGAMIFVVAHEAWASSRSYVATNPTWHAECGSCHFAYPPQLLPARAWRSIMTGLNRHFGNDASVSPGAAAEIGAFLEQHAGSDRRARGALTLRVTEAAWFGREHRKVSAAIWKLPAVRTPANCTACHTTAEHGDFRERNIRIPH